MNFIQIVIPTTLAISLVFSYQPVLDPCGEMMAKGMYCGQNQDCRLVLPPYCPTPPCSPEPRCVPLLQQISTCRYGKPVVDVHFRALTCYPGVDCPYHTTCNMIRNVRNTCCWTPMVPVPQFQLPNHPPQTQYNPCLATTCHPGQICEVRHPNNCYYGPCRPAGVCVVPPGRTFTLRKCVTGVDDFGSKNTLSKVIMPRVITLRPPLEKPITYVTNCAMGYHCEERSTPCSPPGPCPLWGVCVRDHTFLRMTGTKPGQCPVVSGACDNACEMDSDCDGVQKCCPHSCGAVCSDPSVVTTPVPFTSNYPCSTVTCPYGLECRLRQSYCYTPPCQILQACVPITRKYFLSPCPVGDPIVDSNNNELNCGNGFNTNVCPIGTFCKSQTSVHLPVCCHGTNTHAVTTPAPFYASCLHMTCRVDEVCRLETDFCTAPPCQQHSFKAVCRPKHKQGSCPSQQPSSTGQQRSCASSCSSDGDCPGDYKCCGQCPRKCVRPSTATGKPGTCPPSSGSRGRVGGMCMIRCFTDEECPGTLKCCGKCHKFCRLPRPDQLPEVMNTAPAAPVSYSKLGTCPRTTGQMGSCVRLCSRDENCPGTQKCCSNGCGYSCLEPVGSGTATYVNSDPCRTQICGMNYVCQLQQGVCLQYPCSLSPNCVSKFSVTSPSPCQSGYPVTDTSQRPFSCNRYRQTCPAQSVCIDSVCCWDTSITLPPPNSQAGNGQSQQTTGRCPVLSGTSAWYFCSFSVNCSADEDCDVGKMCCPVISCGNRCTTPIR